jgi:hypothetical protein
MGANSAFCEGSQADVLDQQRPTRSRRYIIPEWTFDEACWESGKNV